MSAAVVLLLCGGLSGCGDLVVTALPIHEGPFEMPDDVKQLCETESGVHVFANIESVDSVVQLPTVEIVNGERREYGSPCRPCLGLGSLSDDPPELPVKERYFSEPERTLYPKPLERQGNGYYRYELVRRPSSMCEPFDHVLSYTHIEGLIERGSYARKEALEESCVTAVRIAQPTSAYSLQHIVVEESRRYRGNAARLRRSTYELKRRSDGKLFAQQTIFSFLVTGFVNNPSIRCPGEQSGTLAQAFLKLNQK